MKYIIDIPNEMVIKSPLKGLTLGIAMIETSTQKQFIVPTNIPLIPYIETQKWVPCSERLPDEETDVIVTRTFLGCKDGSRGWNNHIPPKTYVEVAQYFNGEWTALSDEYKVARNRHTDPVAWMPLPEPWKGEEE